MTRHHGPEAARDARRAAQEPCGGTNRPASTITGGATAAWVNADEHRQVTVYEAAILQGFRPDYPWRGNKTSQYGQVGNAIPPPLAAAILRPLIAAAGEVAA